MKKLLFVYIFLYCLVCLGCDYNQVEISDRIYKTFFQNIIGISIMTTDNDLDIRDTNQINTIKTEMRGIKIVKKYSSILNEREVFINENFRLMLILTKINSKKNKVWQALCSTKDSIMIVREGDLFPDKRPKKMGEKLFVYEFKVSQKVNNLLKQRENNISKKGFFFNTWANPELFISNNPSGEL